MKIFLDDTRPAPEGWTLMRWPHEVIAALQSERVAEISLDHDLGDDQTGTGYDVLVWLENIVARHRFVLPIIHIHTANSAARPRMLAAVAQIEKLSRLHPPMQANPNLKEAVAALQTGAQHPARWPGWYDPAGSSAPARQWIESLYAAGAILVMMDEMQLMDDEGGWTAFLQLGAPTDPQQQARLEQALTPWADACCIAHEESTLDLCLRAHMLPWSHHAEARAWLAAGTAQQPRTLGHSSDGPLDRQAAQQLIDGLYAQRAAHVSVQDLQTTGDTTVAWALRVTLPSHDIDAKRKLQAVCWMLTRLLEVSLEPQYGKAEKALYQSTLELCRELAYELHRNRDAQHAHIDLNFLFFAGWGELLQPAFSLAQSERTSP